MSDTPSNSELTDAEKRDCVCRLAFGGDETKLDQFCQVVKESIPHGTGVVLRGSSVTGKRWSDGAPFDADGPGTSDLDLTLVGDDAELVVAIVERDRGALRELYLRQASAIRRGVTSDDDVSSADEPDEMEDEEGEKKKKMTSLNGFKESLIVFLKRSAERVLLSRISFLRSLVHFPSARFSPARCTIKSG